MHSIQSNELKSSKKEKNAELLTGFSRYYNSAVSSVSAFFARSPWDKLYDIVNSKVAKSIAMASFALGTQMINPAAALEANGAEGVYTAKQITTEQVQNIAPGLTAAVESLSTPETQGIVNLDTTNPLDILTKLTAEHLYQSEVQARGGEEDLSISQQKEIYSRVSKIANELQPELQTLLNNNPDFKSTLGGIIEGKEMDSNTLDLLQKYLDTLADATNDNANLEPLHDAVEDAYDQLETLNSKTTFKENSSSTKGSFEKGGVIGDLITSIGDGINDVKYRVKPYLTFGNALILIGLAGGISMTVFGAMGFRKEKQKQKIIVRNYRSRDRQEPASDESKFDTSRESATNPILSLDEKRAFVDHFQPAIEDQDQEHPLIVLFDRLQAEDQDVIFEILDHLYSFDPTFKSILGKYGDIDISKDSNGLIDLLDPNELATLEGLIHDLISQYRHELDETYISEEDDGNGDDVDDFEPLELDNSSDFETLNIFTKQRLVLKFNEAQSLEDYVNVFTTLKMHDKRRMLNECIDYYSEVVSDYNISLNDQPIKVDVAGFLNVNYDDILSSDRTQISALFNEPELKLISLVIKKLIGRYNSEVKKASTLPQILTQTQPDVAKPLYGAEYADFKNRIMLSFEDLVKESISGKTYLDIFVSLGSSDRSRLTNDMLEVYYQVSRQGPEYFSINKAGTSLIRFIKQNRETLENGQISDIESLLDNVTKANFNVLIEMLIEKYRGKEYFESESEVTTESEPFVRNVKYEEELKARLDNDTIQSILTSYDAINNRIDPMLLLNSINENNSGGLTLVGFINDMYQLYSDNTQFTDTLLQVRNLLNSPRITLT